MNESKGPSTMTRIALLGARGRMGSAITRIAEGEFGSRAHIALPLDRDSSPEAVTHFSGYDVLVDVSLPEACAPYLKQILAVSPHAAPPLVVGSTGWKDAQSRLIDEYSARGPVLTATNFSPAVTLMNRMMKDYGPLLKKLGYTVAIEDIHHEKKLDAPSGTAKTLMGHLQQAGLQPQVHSERTGTVVGIHTVTFSGPEDVLEVRHEALNRDLFARGAVLAALWLAEQSRQKPGLKGRFTMENVFFQG